MSFSCHIVPVFSGAFLMDLKVYLVLEVVEEGWSSGRPVKSQQYNMYPLLCPKHLVQWICICVLKSSFSCNAYLTDLEMDQMAGTIKQSED